MFGKQRLTANHLHFFCWIALLTTLFALRVYLTGQDGLFDYDSVVNLRVIKGVANGDLSEVFRHASPTFFLGMAIPYAIFPSMLVLEWVIAGVNLLAIALGCWYAGRELRLGVWKQLFLLAWVGTSLFLTVSARYLAIESPSLLLYTLMLIYYHQHLKYGSRKYWIAFWLAFAILFSINYKILLFLPILAFYEFALLHRSRSWKEFILPISFFCTIPIVFTIVAAAIGPDWLLYLKYLYSVATAREMHPEINVPRFNLDILYYGKYLASFEFPLLLMIVIGTFVFIKNHKTNLLGRIKGHAKSYLTLTLFTSLCWIAGMSILQKAPRGILWAYPYLYLFSFWAIHKLFEKKAWVASVFVICAIGYNLFMINRHIYQYSQETNYPKIAQHIHERGIKKLVTTVGINVVPYLDEDIEVSVVFNGKEALELAKQGFTHCLIDDYRYASELTNFSELTGLPSEISLVEPTLHNPFIYLESCQFAGKDFSWAISTQKEIASKRDNLVLVSLPMPQE